LASAEEQANPNMAFQEFVGQRTTACPLSRSVNTSTSEKDASEGAAAMTPPSHLPSGLKARNSGWKLAHVHRNLRNLTRGRRFGHEEEKAPKRCAVCDTQLTFGSISVSFRSDPLASLQHRGLNPSRARIGNPATISCLHTQLDVTRDIPRSICLHKLAQAFHRCPLNIVALQEIGWPKNCVSKKPQIDSCKIILPTFFLRSRIHSEFPLQE
jgi:hypothetical protein